MCTMTRARSNIGEPIRASTHQYKARFLLYAEGAGWDGIPKNRMDAAIAGRMPAGLRPLWGRLATGLYQANTQSEDDLTCVCAWISVHGPAAGFRIPNVQERARNMGMEAYIRDLARLGDLTEKEVFDAEGNSFDFHAVMVRTAVQIARWTQGEPIRAHQYPRHVASVQAHADAKDFVRAQGMVPPTTGPHPDDLARRLVVTDYPFLKPISPERVPEPPEAAAGCRGT